MNKRSFFTELKRRNVYKVAVAYAVAGWLLIQEASIALGFPVALVLAWAFEPTPEGFQRAEDISPADSITRRTGRKLQELLNSATASQKSAAL